MHKNRCRVCGDTLPTLDLFSISFEEHSLPYLIHRYLYFKVEKEDGLPQEICGLCFMKITDIHKFAKSAAKIQEMFIPLGANKNEEEIVLLAAGENTETHAPLLNNEEITEWSALQTVEEKADSSFNNCNKNTESPGETPHKTMETQEENCFQSGFGGKSIVSSMELPKNCLTKNSESENVNGQQQEEEASFSFASEMEVTTFSDHTSNDLIEVGKTLSSNNIRTEEENSVTATTEVEKSGDTRQPDDTPEENTEEENRKQSNQKCSISAKHSSDGKKIENSLITKLQILLYKCPYCDYNNSEKHLLKEHIDRHHNKTYNKYDINKKVHIRKQPLNYTKFNRVEEKSYFCKLCNMGFCGRSELISHYRLEHEDEKPYKCKICVKKFVKKSSLKEHVLLHGEIKSDWPRCLVCNKVFPAKSDLKKHTSRVHNTRTVYHAKCDICNKNFSQKLSLKRHIDAHFNLLQRMFKCAMCNKNFYSYWQMRKHKLSHSNRMPYKCNLCRMNLVPNYKLYEHFEFQHEGKVSLTCDICKNTFMTKDSLDKHFCQPYDGAKLNVCPICQKVYNNQRAVAQHMTKIHQKTLRLDYKCDICKRYIDTKWKLELHINLHLRRNDKPFKCELCNYRCSYKYQLENHSVSSKHGGNEVCN